jgi:hypothetical protein
MSTFLNTTLVAAVVICIEWHSSKALAQTQMVTLDTVTNTSLVVSSNQAITVMGTLGVAQI